MDIKTFSRVLKKVYDPPIRGRFSKKKRIRKKAHQKYKKTLGYLATIPNPLVSMIITGVFEWGGADIYLPIQYKDYNEQNS